MKIIISFVPLYDMLMSIRKYNIGMRMQEIAGVITALITPFKDDYSIDMSAMEEIINWQIDSGIKAFVLCGTTGESPTLTKQEYKEMIIHAVRCMKGRAILVVNVGTNNTDYTLNLAEIAQDNGADCLMTVVPYYNKPTQLSMIEHFRYLHDNTTLPIILYDVPSRTNAKISDNTLIQLSLLSRIIGIKDASDDMTRPMRLRNDIRDFIWLSGDDLTSLAFNMYGGSGCISVLSNIVPKEIVAIQKLMQSNNYQNASENFSRLYKICNDLFITSNPIPVKYALFLMNKIRLVYRRPLYQPSNEEKEMIRASMQELGII